MTSQLSMYEASVPVFSRYLNQLDKMLVLAEKFAIQQNQDPQWILQASLSPTMHPFAVQVEIAVNFAVRACAPLAGLATPPFGEHRGSLASLRSHIAQTKQFLSELTASQMKDSVGKDFSDQAGDAMLTLPGPEFLLQYALPNFLFHMTAAYAILRYLGAEIGKADFDGYHSY